MEIKKGIGVSPGVVISTAVVLDAEDLRHSRAARSSPTQVPAEIERFGKAVAESRRRAAPSCATTSPAKHGKEIGGIFDFHLGILRDKSLLNADRQRDQEAADAPPSTPSAS